MKTTKHPIVSFFSLVLIGTLLIFSTQNCKKPVIVESFTEAETLGCSNLLIRNVFFKDSIIEVILENTCNNCKENLAYFGMTMIDRQNPSDTLAWDCGTCISCPKNGETKKYQLNTKLKRLPALGRVQFDFGNLCKDLIYLPK
jgi:hypothetical protein